MKKIVSLIILSIMIMMVSVSVFATDAVLGDTNNATTITGNEYENAQQNVQNVQNNATTLPQTGIEDSGLGILLVVLVASAIFAYKKVSDYRGI